MDVDLRLDALVLAENPDALVALDGEGRVLHWNAAAAALFGHGADEAQGQPLEQLIVGDAQREDFRRTLREAEAAPAGATRVHEALRQRKDGSLLNVSGSTRAVRQPDGRLRCFVLTMRDVTVLQAQRDARIVEARFRDLLEHTPDAILIVNAAGLIVLANAQSQRVFGYDRDALIGLRVEKLLPERYRSTHIGHRAAFIGQPRRRSMGAGLELFGRRQDGEEFPVEVSLSPLQGDEGPMVMCAVRDMTERLELRRGAERQFRDLLESAPDAMVIVDAAGTIVLVNSQAESLFGWRREELLGQPVDMLVPPRFRGVHPVHRTAFFASPKPRQMGAGLDLSGLRKDGSEFPVEISLSPIQTEGGQLVASAIRDATERKRTELVLQEANRMKSEFLANMSHELRTPLNGILGFSELLVDERFGHLNDKQREYINDIHECGKHLLQLINNVLDLSKVEAGKMHNHVEAFSPADAVAAVCSVVGPLARKKRLQLVQPGAALVPTVSLDLQKFRQILLNLLSNAIKFTEPGGLVRVELVPTGQERSDHFVVAVHDTGIGIAPEHMDRLFEAFRQIDGGLARRHEGTGLGLALTRKLVELMHGRIEVRSEPGRGSSFIVTLPRTLPAAPELDAAQREGG